MRLLLILLLLPCMMLHGQMKPFVSSNATTMQGFGDIGVYQTGKVYEYNFNAESRALFARMSEQPSNPVKILISNTIDSLKKYAIWDSAFSINFYGINTIENALLDWKGNYNSTKSAGAFYFLPYYGLQSDGSASYLNTNFTPRTAGMAAGSLAFGNYIVSSHYYPGYAASSNRNSPMGAFTSNYTVDGLLQYNHAYSFTINNSWIQKTTNVAVPLTTSRGVIILSRQGNNSYTYVDKAKTTHSATAPVSLTPNIPMYVFGSNSNSTLINPDQHMIGFTIISRYLTEAQVGHLTDIIKYHYDNLPLPTTVHDTLDVQYKVATLNHYVFPIIHYQRSSGAKLASYKDSIFFSVNNGVTWPYKRKFVNGDRISMSYIYPNNTIVFATNKNKIYYSKDSLQTINAVSVQDSTGSDFTFHTPADTNYPGDYFKTLTRITDININGGDVLAFGNYCNYLNGASPVILWSSVDTGKTIKAVYMFGKNTSYRDDGSYAGSNSTGTLLGAARTIYARHIHFVRQGPDSLIYFGTGDADANEQHWFSADLVSGNTWTVTELVNGTTARRFKSGDACFIGDSVIFTSDHYSDPGIFKCKIGDLGTTVKHKKVLTTTYTLGSIIVESNGKGMAGAYGDKNNIYTTTNYGNTWVRKALNHVNARSNSNQSGGISEIFPADSDGWYVIYPTLKTFAYNKEQAFYFKLK